MHWLLDTDYNMSAVLLTIKPGVNIGPGVSVKVPTPPPPPPNGLTSATASTSAWQIKQDYPNSTDGLYWIQTANINSGTAVQIYADMTTNGGGWTLLVQNNYNQGWDNNTTLLRNSTTPPSTLTDYTYEQTFNNNYSILGWADYIKKNVSGSEATFDYMLDAAYRGRNGGIWTANENYSFVGTGTNGISFGNQQLLGYTSGSPPVTGDAGFRKNITEIEHFPAGAPGDISTWTYQAFSIEARMPYVGKQGGFLPGGGMLLGTDSDGSWWGTIISCQGFNPAPWIDGGVYGDVSQQGITQDPHVIWYWVR